MYGAMFQTDVLPQSNKQDTRADADTKVTLLKSNQPDV
jgi:hypothetical protein